jgi:TctA family transporter
VTNAIGVLGFFMRRYAFPIAPVILGVILGPVMETQFRRALTASGGDMSVFYIRPLTIGLLSVACWRWRCHICRPSSRVCAGARGPPAPDWRSPTTTSREPPGAACGRPAG